MLSCDEIAHSTGTVITVRDLFFNVPARKKFLRSEQTELAHIASLVTHYSLAHPDKTFELWNGAANLLHATPVETAAEIRDVRLGQFAREMQADFIEHAAEVDEVAHAVGGAAEAGDRLIHGSRERNTLAKATAT